MASYSGQTPDTLPHRHDWMEVMACRDEEPDLFYDSSQRHEARTVCVARCSVRRECRAHILKAEEGLGLSVRDGIVAGLEAKERWQLDAAVSAQKGADAAAYDAEPPECGTHRALHRHLQLGEQVDPLCWSAEERRHSQRSRRSAVEERPAAVAQPARVDAAPPAEGGPEVAVGGLWIDGATRAATLNGQPLSLSVTQIALLRYLAERAGRTVGRAELLKEVCGLTHTPGSRAVNVLVKRLREKLPPEHASLIRAVRGAGYRLEIAHPEAGSDAPDPVQQPVVQPLELPKCGTSEAFRRHLERHETVDPACWNARTPDDRKYLLNHVKGARGKAPAPIKSSAQQEPLPRKRGRSLAPCGTNSAYNRHIRRREPIDDACRIAHTEADRRLRTTGTSVKLGPFAKPP